MTKDMMYEHMIYDHEIATNHKIKKKKKKKVLR